MAVDEIKSIKQRYGIVGTSPLIDRAIDVARQVARTDITVLILGESGVGKEVFPRMIHDMSARKHEKYIAVNCGAIPEGTTDSELFGHVKGSFTGAHEDRQGYFETANKGTIFLDEVAELPLATQARLLRVLESGEFYKVGSSKVQTTDVRVIAATNVNFSEQIQKGKFRNDLYYRLNTVPIYIPPLRERKEDIYPIFRKYASDFAEKNRIPTVILTPEARTLLESYRWEGNVRQLKNVSEQISIMERDREISAETLKKYLPAVTQSTMPTVYNNNGQGGTGEFSERELLYKILFDMKRDISELRQTLNNIICQNDTDNVPPPHISSGIQQYEHNLPALSTDPFESGHHHFDEPAKQSEPVVAYNNTKDIPPQQAEVVEDEELSIASAEKLLIKKALVKYQGNRKQAAKELGISERTLYRKISEYELE